MGSWYTAGEANNIAPSNLLYMTEHYADTSDNTPPGIAIARQFQKDNLTTVKITDFRHGDYKNTLFIDSHVANVQKEELQTGMTTR